MQSLYENLVLSDYTSNPGYYSLFSLPGPCRILSLHSHFHHVGGAAGMAAKVDLDCHSHCDQVLLPAPFPE